MKIDFSKNTLSWSIIIFIISFSFIISLFYKTTEEIIYSMSGALYWYKPYPILTRIIFITVFLQGIYFKKINDELFVGAIAFFAITACIIAIIFMLIPDIFLFALIIVLSLNAYFNKQLRWDLKNTDNISRFFGGIGFVFGFWYLYWIEEPIWLNALFFSPLGILNSPTLLIICGFLCLNKEPRSKKLEISVAIISFWIGIMGIFRFGIYIDIALVIMALFIFIRPYYYNYCKIQSFD